MIDISHIANEAKKSGRHVQIAEVEKEDKDKKSQRDAQMAQKQDDGEVDGKEPVKISFTPLGQTEAGKKIIARYTGPKTKDKDQKPKADTDDKALSQGDQALTANMQAANQ